jgi:hypothetical protein
VESRAGILMKSNEAKTRGRLCSHIQAKASRKKKEKSIQVDFIVFPFKLNNIEGHFLNNPGILPQTFPGTSVLLTK